MRKNLVLVTKDFLQSMYSLEKNAYEQLFEQISQYLEIDDIEVSEEKIEEFKDFLMLYFSF